MVTAKEQIEALAARAKQAPEARQREIVAALREILDEPYQLTDAELAVLKPALEEALSGRNLTDAKTDDLLNKPWS